MSGPAKGRLSRVGSSGSAFPPPLLVLRGPSGSGKSSIAEAVRTAVHQGAVPHLTGRLPCDADGRARVTVVGQDLVRRRLLKEPDVDEGINVALIAQIAVFSLERGALTIIEGIMDASRYGAMLRGLHASSLGPTYAYFIDASFGETLRRHATKPNAADFGESEMRKWYKGLDLVSGLDETVIPEGSTAAQTLARILADLA